MNSFDSFDAGLQFGFFFLGVGISILLTYLGWRIYNFTRLHYEAFSGKRIRFFVVEKIKRTETVEVKKL